MIPNRMLIETDEALWVCTVVRTPVRGDRSRPGEVLIPNTGEKTAFFLYEDGRRVVPGAAYPELGAELTDFPCRGEKIVALLRDRGDGKGQMVVGAWAFFEEYKQVKARIASRKTPPAPRPVPSAPVPPAPVPVPVAAPVPAPKLAPQPVAQARVAVQPDKRNQTGRRREFPKIIDLAAELRNAEAEVQARGEGVKTESAS